MKTILKFTGLFFAAAVLFTGCMDKDDAALDNPGNFWQGYADVQFVEGREAMNSAGIPGFNLILDDGTVLEVVSFLSPIPDDYEVTDGMRVLANFSKISENTSTVSPMPHWPPYWQVRLNGMEKILTKAPVEGDGTELGDDPINVRRMWLSGKYLNATFLFKWNDASIVHGINLWVDAEHPGADAQNVYVELRHNARGDRKYYEAFGRVSFDIRELIGQNTVTIHFSYTDYTGSRHTVSKLYSPNVSEEPGDLDISSGGQSNMN